MAGSNSKKYDCLLIYDHESSSSKVKEDRSFLESYVEFVDKMLKQNGLRTHHHSRDSTPGEILMKELEREVESSQVVLLILDKGFLDNSWMSFCKDVTIKNLIDEPSLPGRPGVNRFIPILIKLKKPDIPFELKATICLQIMKESDIENEEMWIKLTRSLCYHFKDQFPPAASMQHSLQRTPKYRNASAEPSESRVDPGSNDTILPNPNTVDTTSDSFSTGRNASRQSNENETSEERYQEESLRTRESETNQSITEISNEVEGATNVDINESRALGTTFRTLSLPSTDLEVDAEKSVHTWSPFQVTERESSDTRPLMNPVITSNNLNRKNVLANSSIQEDATDRDVNQNLKASIAASGGNFRQRESLDPLAEPLRESTTSSASRSSLSRPTVAVQPYTSDNTSDDNDQRRSVETDNSSATLPDEIESLR